MLLLLELVVLQQQLLLLLVLPPLLCLLEVLVWGRHSYVHAQGMRQVLLELWGSWVVS